MEAAARAENAVIAHALERGYLRPPQLEEARRLLDRQHPRGRPPGALLQLLRREFLDAGLEQDLLRVYRQALEGEDTLEGTLQVEVPEVTDDASGDPEPAARFRETLADESDDDLRITQEYEDGPPPGYLPPRPPPPPAPLSPTASWRKSAGPSPLGSGMAMHASDTWDEGDDISVGPYRVLGELARGGMGVVYRARHVDLPRDVAIKMLLAGEHATPAQLERFSTEARAAARLRHPNLVAIHDVGIQGGHPYVVMDYVPGESLQERIKSQGPLPIAEAARIALTLAQALDYAHRQHVIHRDVTPLNVLIATDGRPVLTDFGLAKELDAVGTGVTQSGQFVGTPAYTPPEQAAGRREEVDERCDVYGLGATLYACLTGQPPFDAETPLEILAQITDQAPRPPRKLRPEVPPELEAVCLRCLQKDPARRYPTMRALVDELSRQVPGGPLPAVPLVDEGPLAGRLPALAAALAAALLLAIGVGAWRSSSLSGELAQARREAEAIQSRLDAAAAEGQRTQARLSSELAAARDAARDATRERDGAKQGVAAAWLQAGAQALAAGDPRQAGLAFAQAHIAAGDDGSLKRAARYGAREAAAQVGLRGRLVSRAGLVLGLRFSSTGDRLITTTVGRGVVEWDLSRMSRLRTYDGHHAAVAAVGLSPTDRYMLTGSEDKTIRLWDRETGAGVRVLKGLSDAVLEVAFARGRGAAVVASGKRVAMFDLSNGQQLARTPEHPNDLRSLDVSRDQRRLVTACGDTHARLFDLTSAAPLRTITSRTQIVAARFRGEGRQVVTLGAYGNLAVWDAASGKLLRSLAPPATGGRAAMLRLSRDGRLAAVATLSGHIRLIDLPEGRELARLRTASGLTIELAFSPDGRTLAVAAGRVTELRSLNAVLPTSDGTQGLTPGVRFAPGGGIATFAKNGVLVIGPGAGRQQRYPSDGPMIESDLSRDGARLATVGKGGVVVFARRSEQVVDHVRALAFAVAFSPDGKLLAIPTATSGRQTELRLRDVTARRDVARAVTGHRAPVGACGFSPDGRHVVTGDVLGVGRVWSVDGDALTERAVLRRTDASSRAISARAAIDVVTFDRQGKRVITGHQDGWVVVWDAATGRQLRALRAHADRVSAIALAPDGALLVTSSYDHTVKLWDLLSGILLRTLPLPAAVVTCDLSPDGARLITGCKDGRVRFFNASRPAIPGFDADPLGAVRRALGIDPPLTPAGGGR